MTSARTNSEVIQTLEDLRTTLDLLVAHLGLQGEVQLAIAARRAKVEASRVEIERSLGKRNVDGDGRR
jgi:hypothetical protein